MLPGAPPGMVLPNSIISREELESDLSSILSDTDAIQTTIENDLVETYTNIDRTLEGISANVVGNIANDLEGIEAVHAKLSKKVISSITDTLSEVYGKILDLGFNIPTVDDVRYAKASGDYIGSMTGAARFDPAANSFQNVGPTVGPTPPTFNLLCPPEDQTNFGGVMVCGVPSVVPYQPNSNSFGTDVPTTTGSGSGCDPGPITGIENLGTRFRQWVGQDGVEYAIGFAGEHTGEPEGSWCLWIVTSNSDAGGVAETAQMILPAGPMFPVIEALNGRWIGATSENQYVRRVKCAIVSYCYSTNKLETTPPTTLPEEEPGASCPVPPKVHCVDDFKMDTFNQIFGVSDFCKDIEKVISSFTPGKSKFENLLTVGQTLTNAAANPNSAAGVINTLLGVTLPQLMKRLGKHIDNVVQQGLVTPSCNAPVFTGLATASAAVNFIQQYTGALPPQIIETWKQLLNYACQYQIPSPAEADAMLLAKTISNDTWICLQKAAGNLSVEFEPLLDAKRTRTDPQSLSQLFRRKQINQKQFDERMRENGVLYGEDAKDIYNMTQAWPSMSDVTRFLVRDVADKKIVDRFNMDDDFPEKWQGKLIEYADAIGVNEDLGKYYWRAHWHIPSFTMLSEMLHRLRPGQVDEKVAVTREDVFEALKQDDWLPFWANRMIETSYKPVTKTDAVRAYMVHAIDEAGLKGHYLDVGYNEKSADFYVAYQKKLRKIAEAKSSGMPTIRMLTRQYARCEISEEQYRKAMEKLVLSPEHEAQALEAARAAKKVEETKLSMRMVQIPFKLGLLDFDEATNMLSQTELDPACVRSMVDSWSLQQLKRPKHLAAGQLCKMRERGIITQAQQIQALVRNNWSKEDATRIAQECDATVTEKQFKRSQMNAEKAQRLREKLAKEQAKRLKLEACGPPSCPANTPGGKLDPPNIVPDSLNL